MGPVNDKQRAKGGVIGEDFVPMAFTSSGGTPQVTDWLLKQIAEAGDAHDCSNPIPIAEIRDAIAQEIAVGTAISELLRSIAFSNITLYGRSMA